MNICEASEVIICFKLGLLNSKGRDDEEYKKIVINKKIFKSCQSTWFLRILSRKIALGNMRRETQINLELPSPGNKDV